MLLELRVKDLALVDDLVIPFAPGLTVLTGETGAGKSLIAGALALLCGQKSDKERVRQGQELAFVEALFDLSEAPEQRRAMARLGVRIAEDGILLLRRELRREGRSRVIINGLVSSLALLQQAGSRLLSIQSQDQQRELSDPGFVRALLDEQLAVTELLQEVSEALSQYRAMQARLAEREAEEALAREQLDLWRYQHQELAEANLDLDELDPLRERLLAHRHASALQEGATAAWTALSEGQGPARERLGEAISALKLVADKSPKLEHALGLLRGAEDAIAEAAGALNRFLDGLDLAATDLQDLEQRLALYEELQRKYRRDLPDLLVYRDRLGQRIARQDSSVAELKGLREQLERDRQCLQDKAAALHQRRRSGAAGVARAAQALIAPLSLPYLELEFAVLPREDPDGPIAIEGVRCQVRADGADRITLRVRTNPGAAAGSVEAIASGGERSRIHLGLTVLRRQAAEPPLMLFDEIDAGLGMDAAQPVALLLKKLSESGQVVCITHLPTIAVHGASHLQVRKISRKGVTRLEVCRLEPEPRVQEIARLLGGKSADAGDAEVQESYARELLRLGRRTRATSARG